jgi:hypothetical protein
VEGRRDGDEVWGLWKGDANALLDTRSPGGERAAAKLMRYFEPVAKRLT